MQNHFQEFISSSNLGQTDQKDKVVVEKPPGFSSHLPWMIIAAAISSFLGWKACKFYSVFKEFRTNINPAQSKTIPVQNKTKEKGAK